jgi:hypothetical protein
MKYILTTLISIGVFGCSYTETPNPAVVNDPLVRSMRTNYGAYGETKDEDLTAYKIYKNSQKFH